MARKLWINGKLANINGRTKGILTYQSIPYEWDNAPEVIIPKTFMTSENQVFITADNKTVVVKTSKSKVSKGIVSITNNGKVSNRVLNLVKGSVENDTLIL